MAGKRVSTAGFMNALLHSDHYESLTEELRCGGCKNYMAAPIRLCGGGHAFCAHCYKSLPECSLCSSAFSDVRCVVLESMSKKFLFPCSNADCIKRTSLERLDAHVKNCTHRIIDCFMDRVYGDCGWHGKAGDWLTHCFEMHKNRVSDLPFLKLRDKWNPKTKDPVINYHIMRCYENVFNLYQLYDKKGGKMIWTVLWNDAKDPNKFYYEIEIVLPKDPTKKIMFRRPVKSDKDADFLEYTQNVYVPIDTVFNMLDEGEHLNITVRVGESDSLPLLESTQSESQERILLTDLLTDSHS